MMDILYIILGCIFGGLLIYLILKPKLKQTQQLDENVAKQNETLYQLNDQARLVKEKLENEIDTLNKEEHVLNSRYQELYYEVGCLNAQKKELSDSVKEAKETSEQYYDTLMNSVMNRFEMSAQSLGYKYQEAEEDYKKEYSALMEECLTEYQNKIDSHKAELKDLRIQLDDAHNIVNAAVEANRRAEEIKEQQNYYKLILLKEDIEEIEKLREVVPYLRDPSTLNKVIWKVYYEKPYTDLIGRVVGNKPTTGIYKITNIDNGMCYVGQAVNIAERWRQHIKRGLGAETPTRNKLYPAMAQFGVENFTFEIVEKCPAAALNEKEDYWQDYFHAKDFGYSIK